MADDLDDVVDGINGFDGGAVEEAIKPIEAEQANIDAIMEQAREDCLPHRAAMKEAKKQARKALKVKAEPLNNVLRKRKLERKIDGIPANMDEADNVTYEQLVVALGDLGDTPLGEAALSVVE